jgi:predicted LPLAT superfamily acyltransferase
MEEKWTLEGEFVEVDRSEQPVAKVLLTLIEDVIQRLDRYARQSKFKMVKMIKLN